MTDHIGEYLWEEVSRMKDVEGFNISKTLYRFDIGRTRFYDIFKEKQPGIKHIALLSVMLGKDYHHLIPKEHKEQYEDFVDLERKRLEKKDSEKKGSVPKSDKIEVSTSVLEGQLKQAEEKIKHLMRLLEEKDRIIETNEKLVTMTNKYIQLLESKNK